MQCRRAGCVLTPAHLIPSRALLPDGRNEPHLDLNAETH
ncbi:hypothetical protein Mnod_6298 [Methylobacterium nodulans ORS 2060]|uniref:Uncharacterized protein n=1 Tax=Methylobacterium nodulans (strain LMG 21967 / CNCM I-2342 / ORS 2060) TaxID=460265 RepID=B8IAQ7_METNO|nr:hypothetical protein Mnod_6298 [Methylobacterium nodulans ORS 2060]